MHTCTVQEVHPPTNIYPYLIVYFSKDGIFKYSYFQSWSLFPKLSCRINPCQGAHVPWHVFHHCIDAISLTLYCIKHNESNSIVKYVSKSCFNMMIICIIIDIEISMKTKLNTTSITILLTYTAILREVLNINKILKTRLANTILID